jgi:hypothetical protein
VWNLGASVFQFRSGKVTQLLLYTDYQWAFADLGLS